MAWFAFIPMINAVSQARVRFLPVAMAIGGIPWAGVSTLWIAESGSGSLALKWAVTTTLALIPWLLFGLIAPALVSLRLPASLWASMAWVAGEFVFCRFCCSALGCRSCSIGESQLELTPVAAWAQVGGVESLSFLILSMNGLVLDCCRLRDGRQLFWAALPPAATILLFTSLHRAPPALSLEWQVGLCPRVLVTPNEVPARVREMSQDVDFWVFPEFGCLQEILEPPSLSYEKPIQDRTAAAYLKTGEICGSPVVIGVPIKRHGAGMVNGALLIHPKFGTIDITEKHQLVVFHEMFRLDDVGLVLKNLSRFQPDMVAGRGSKCIPVSLAGRQVNLSVIICSEVGIAHLVRNSLPVRSEDPTVLVVVGNEARIQSSQGKRFLWRQARWRCIENNVPLVRCVSKGVSGVIDAKGKGEIKDRLLEQSISSQETVCHRLPLGPDPSSAYRELGPVVSVGCSLVSLLIVVWTKASRFGSSPKLVAP